MHRDVPRLGARFAAFLVLLSLLARELGLEDFQGIARNANALCVVDLPLKVFHAHRLCDARDAGSFCWGDRFHFALSIFVVREMHPEVAPEDATLAAFISTGSYFDKEPLAVVPYLSRSPYRSRGFPPGVSLVVASVLIPVLREVGFGVGFCFEVGSFCTFHSSLFVGLERCLTAFF